MTILLNNVDTDTPSDEFASKGGTAIITVRATDFGSATLEIQTASSSDSLNRFLVLNDILSNNCRCFGRSIILGRGFRLWRTSDII